jgi:hypothetical protein
MLNKMGPLHRDRITEPGWDQAAKLDTTLNLEHFGPSADETIYNYLGGERDI